MSRSLVILAEKANAEAIGVKICIRIKMGF